MESLLLWVSLAFSAAVLAAVAADDLRRMRGPARRVRATVKDHRRDIGADGESHAAIYEFADESGRPVRVTDNVYHPAPTPPLGAVVDLVHPAGREELARPPRPWLRVAIYAALGYLVTILALRIAGVLR